jgi:hypothetical protein
MDPGARRLPQADAVEVDAPVLGARPAEWWKTRSRSARVSTRRAANADTNGLDLKAQP